MSIEKVRAYFRSLGIEERVQEFPVSSATVELAAQALGVAPQRIAKTLSFKLDERTILVVAAGDAKVDNGRYKAAFGGKAKMLTPEEAVERVATPWAGYAPLPSTTGWRCTWTSPCAGLTRSIPPLAAATAPLN